MAIKLEQVRVTTNGKVRLDVPELSVGLGELVVVIGANGAGKSTLLDVLAGLSAPTEGSITLHHGDDTTGPDASTRPPSSNTSLAYLYQTPETSLFGTNASEEFAFTLRRSVDEIVRQWPIVQAKSLSPLGLLDVSPTSLPPTWSTGTKRKFAYALAEAQSAKYLLLDEPTAGLDAKARSAVLCQLQRQVANGQTAIVSTHDLDDFLPMATRVWLLDGGRIVFDGPPEAICAEPERLLEAGVGLSPGLRLRAMLRETGLLPGDTAGTLDDAAPEQLGAKLRIALASGDFQAPRSKAVPQPLDRGERWSDPDDREGGEGRRTPAADIDIRLRWLVLTALTIAIACAGKPAPLAVAVAATIGILIALRTPLRRTMRLTAGWAVFAILTLAVSALQLGPPFHAHPAFHAQAAVQDLREIVPYWCYLQFSQLYVTGFTPLEVGALFARTFGALRLPQPWQRTTGVIAMLVTRYISAIDAMYRQQVRAYEARTLGRRSHARGTSRAWAWLRIVHILTPLVIRLIQFGETTADAMAARLIFIRPFPTNAAPRRRWTWRDVGFTAFGLVATTAVLVLSVCEKR